MQTGSVFITEPTDKMACVRTAAPCTMLIGADTEGWGSIPHFYSSIVNIAVSEGTIHREQEKFK
jgi:hypothetical protein